MKDNNPYKRIENLEKEVSRLTALNGRLIGVVEKLDDTIDSLKVAFFLGLIGTDCALFVAFLLR